MLARAESLAALLERECAFALGLLVLVLTGCGNRTVRRPDVVVIVADDLGWSDVHPLVATPNLERLARLGTTFHQAYAMPICTPSRYALLFGRYGRREGILGGARRIAPGEAPASQRFSLANLFRSAGYSTAAFGKWHVDPMDVPLSGLARSSGFQTFRAGTRGNLGRNPRAYFQWMRIDDGVESESHRYATLAVRDAFLDWWRETEGPRFAYVAFHAVHQPFHQPPPELLDDSTPREGYRAVFEAMVESFDRVLGDLLDELDLTNTLLVFVSDNGTPPLAAVPGQDPMHQKASLFEGGVRVPLVVAGPGAAVDADCTALVHVVDLVATLGGFLGIELPEGAAEDSLSFAPLLGNPAGVGRRETVFFEIGGGEESEGKDEVGVRSATHFLRIVNGAEPSEELYDLRRDPFEQSPLDPDADANREETTRLRAALAALPPRRPD